MRRNHPTWIEYINQVLASYRVTPNLATAETTIILQDRSQGIFKNKQPGKWDIKWRPRYRIVQIEHNGHILHIKNQATRKVQSYNMKDVVLEPPVEFWNIDIQFGRAGKYVNHPANLSIISLND